MLVCWFIDFFGEIRCGLCFVDNDQIIDFGIFQLFRCIFDLSYGDYNVDLLEYVEEVILGIDCIDLLYSNSEINICMYII